MGSDVEEFSGSDLIDLIECCRYGMKAQHEIIDDKSLPDFVKDKFKKNVFRYISLIKKIEIKLSNRR